MVKLKLYLASSFDLVSLVESVSQYLEGHGHEVVVKWWSRDGFDLRDKKMECDKPEDFYGDDICRQIYHRDLQGVKDADVLVLICGKIPKKFNGANVEYGMALALGKPCFSLGSLENSAMYYPLTKCKTFMELGAVLDAEAEMRDSGHKVVR